LPAVRVAVIINPVAGRRTTAEVARRRAELAHEQLSNFGADPDVLVTTRTGHARELAYGAIARGAEIVFAWGGDGTVNEVGCALAFGEAALGIVPGGSGNGLAYALGIPRDPAAALTHGLSAGIRRIDVCEIGGRLFFNTAGVGFDAHVADCFSRDGRARGLRRYAAIVVRELFRYQAPSRRVTIGDRSCTDRTFLLVLANGPQWGNGAMVAPAARLDDGLLDIVTIRARSPFKTLLQIPRLFNGTIAGVRGVTTARAADLRISGDPPLLFHVDGEPVHSTETELRVRVHARALRVRA
jgi:YegS/Rv2252/BmrU family lipid kinase